MKRFQTRRYITTRESEVARLADLDHTPAAEIRVTDGVEPVHVTGGWILWSDKRFTTGIGGDLPKGGQLTKAAEDYISVVRGSDTGCVEGGLIRLAAIAEVLSREDVEVGAARGLYAAERVTRVRVRWTDGTESDLYEHSAGYFEGYMLDVYSTLESLRAASSGAPGPEGITGSLEDYDYDPEVGFIKPEENGHE